MMECRVRIRVMMECHSFTRSFAPRARDVFKSLWSSYLSLCKANAIEIRIYQVRCTRKNRGRHYGESDDRNGNTRPRRAKEKD